MFMFKRYVKLLTVFFLLDLAMTQQAYGMLGTVFKDCAWSKALNAVRNKVHPTNAVVYQDAAYWLSRSVRQGLPRSIYTKSLTGCTVVVARWQHECGGQTGFLSHFEGLDE